ncbi:MAG: nitroreductase/quinone reductase family protein [Actinomycetes bacterium]
MANPPAAVMRAGTAVNMAVYRATKGRVWGRMSGLPVLLLTVPGRKSGKPHTTPVCYLEEGGGWAVTGSAGGADRDPQWFQNLRAAGAASVEIGGRRERVTVRLTSGEERDRIWRRFVDEGKTFGGYEQKTDRVIPVAVLTPTAA